MGDAINMVQIGRRRGFDGKLQKLDTDFGRKKVGSLQSAESRNVDSQLCRRSYVGWREASAGRAARVNKEGMSRRTGM